MKKVNLAGMGSLIGGVALFAFHEMSNFMGKAGDLNAYNAQPDVVGKNKSLYDILPQGNFDWVDRIPWGKVREGVDYVAHTPVWILLVIIGVVLLIMGGIFVKR